MVQITVGAKCWDGARRKTLGATMVPAIPVAKTMREVERRVRLDPKLKAIASFAVPVLFIAGGLPPIGLTHAFASVAAATPGATVAVPAMAPAVQSKIMHAFDPLISLVQSLSYPIAGVMIAAGCLFIMVGNRDRGMQMLQNAAIGYILVQLSPMLLELLVGIGGTV